MSTSQNDVIILNGQSLVFLKVIVVILVIVVLILSYSLWKLFDSPPLDYVDCMVDTYFYGYLKKIVPDHGDSDGGLKDRLKLYKALQNLTDEEFPFLKMFIIIPSSGHIPSNLRGLDSDGRIELRQDMAPKEINRAGVQKRAYKSSVYQVKFRGKHKHITVPMEGAPPLLCLSDSCKENSRLEKYKKDIIYLFYEKLKDKIKKNDDFEDACEVIFLDQSKKENLADILIMKYLDTSD